MKAMCTGRGRNCAVWLGLVMLASMALPNLAWAETAWQKSFAGDAVATYLREGDKSVLVVAGGEKSADLTDAAAALVASLRAHKPALVVMTGEALGNVAALDDEAIAKKAGHLPVGLIAILRVFPGDQPAAVVSFLDKAGTAVAALSVVRGAALARGSKSQGTAGAGVSTAAADTIARIHDEKRGENGGSKSAASGDPDADAAARSEEYAENYVGFQGWIGMNQYGQVVRSFSTIYQGTIHKPLGLGQFYEHIGRKDLADSVQTRGRVRGGLFIGGTVLMIGSLYFLKGVFGSSCAGVVGADAQKACVKDRDQTQSDGLKNTGIMFGAGMVVMFAGLFVSPNPMSEEETYALGGAYNRAMREKLGLVPHTFRWQRGPQMHWFAKASAPNADIGGLSLGLQF